MTSPTKPRNEGGTLDQEFADAIEGYAMSVRCEWYPYDCPNEAAWHTNQHGCDQVLLCDEHFRQQVATMMRLILVAGGFRCNVCAARFSSVGEFVTVRPI